MGGPIFETHWHPLCFNWFHNHINQYHCVHVFTVPYAKKVFCLFVYYYKMGLRFDVKHFGIFSNFFNDEILQMISILHRFKNYNKLEKHSRSSDLRQVGNFPTCCDYPKLIGQLFGIPLMSLSGPLYCLPCVLGLPSLKGLLTEWADYRLWFWLENQGTDLSIEVVQLKNICTNYQYSSIVYRHYTTVLL